MEIDYPEYDDNKIENIFKIYSEIIYEDVLENKLDILKDDILNTITYYSDKEEYEKCIVLKKYLNNNFNE